MRDYQISVVIPNYNNEKYISDCIESIEKQSYPIEKIIVVDDCSKDGSVEVLNQLAQKYDNLQIIALEKNGGVSHARNTGLSAVKTPYVTFLDADDVYFNPDKIKNEMSLVKQHKENSGKDVVAYSHNMLIKQDGSPFYECKYKDKYYNQGSIFKKVLTEKYFFTIMRDYCVNTESLRSVGGYDESSCLWEDLDLILELSKNNEFYYTGEIGTGYRQTQSGLSTRPKKTHKEKKKEIFDNHTIELSKIKKQLFKLLKFIHKYENKFIILWTRAKGKVRKIKGGIKK